MSNEVQNSFIDSPVAEAVVEGLFTTESSEQAPEQQEEVAAEEAVEEAKPEQKSEEDKQFASKFAALSRREKEIRQRESQIEQKLRALDEKLAKLETISAPKEAPKAEELPLELRLKKNPLEALQSIGLSYEKLTQLALNDGKLTPEMQLELMRQELDDKYSKELEKLRSELSEKDKKTEEQKYNDIVMSFKNELNSFLKNNDNDYELINANNAADVVFDVIEEHFKETGRIMDNKEAADLVEAQLLEEAERLFKLNKLKSKLGSTAQVQSKNPAPKSPTLQNTQSVSVSKPAGRPLTREESLAHAASFIKWEE